MIKPISDYECKPLAKDESYLLCTLLLAERDVHDDLHTVPQELLDDPMVQLITKRAECHNVEITPHLAIFLAAAASGIPGRAIQLLHAIAVSTKEESEPVDVATFCCIFAVGLPDDDTYKQAWHDQKDDKGRNKLDYEQWERGK